jgi:putative ABC transport system permease protein
VASRPTKSVNGIQVRKDTFARLDYARFRGLTRAIPYRTEAMMISSSSAEAKTENDTAATVTWLRGISAMMTSKWVVKAGVLLGEEAVANREGMAVINQAFASATRPADSARVWLGRKIHAGGRTLTVVGVVNHRSPEPEVFLPITLLTPDELKAAPPSVVLEAENVVDVTPIRDSLRAWLKTEFPEHANDFDVTTNEFRVEQATRGFMLFRVIMGLIVGISVLVGGIGVMNVMLISVTQRTTEIGVRKAMGAKREDIVMQFLAESITISAFGSLAGLVLGILGTWAFVPIIKALTQVPFQASYTWNTLGVVALVAIAVGILFGTYPALRASRLDPVEAIRRE